jgi:hypothetical protein
LGFGTSFLKWVASFAAMWVFFFFLLNFVKFISWYNIQYTFVEFLLWNLRTQVI